jgi:hypothetical protein
VNLDQAGTRVWLPVLGRSDKLEETQATDQRKRTGDFANHNFRPLRCPAHKDIQEHKRCEKLETAKFGTQLIEIWLEWGIEAAPIEKEVANLQGESSGHAIEYVIAVQESEGVVLDQMLHSLCVKLLAHKPHFVDVLEVLCFRSA